MFNKIYYQNLDHWIMQFKRRISHHGMYLGRIARFLNSCRPVLTCTESLSLHPAPKVRTSRGFRAYASPEFFFFTETSKRPFHAFLRFECAKAKYTRGHIYNEFYHNFEIENQNFHNPVFLKRWSFCLS